MKQSWKIFVGILFGVLLTSCAHVEPPPGGARPEEPLELVGVNPDTLAVVAPFRGPVTFVFNSRLSERAVDEAVLVSPRTSPVQVGRSGREVRVSLREGWAPNQIYHVTVLPVLVDLWNNRFTETVTHVFSTGPTIPETELTGQVIDRITGRPERDARVEAIRVPDSLVYAVRSDSAGRFALARIPVGEYQVRAFRDLNRNRALDPFEPRDVGQATVAVGEPASVRLGIVMPDTTPPVVATARATEAAVEITFDDHLDPAQPIGAEQVRIIGPGGQEVGVARGAVGRLEAPEGEQLPAQTLVIEPATPLQPGTEYRVLVQGVRNVVGLVGGGDTTFTTAAAAAEP